MIDRVGIWAIKMVNFEGQNDKKVDPSENGTRTRENSQNQGRSRRTNEIIGNEKINKKLG
jgi:hypothetical protein